MRKYTLIALIDFTDKYDETIKYVKNQKIVVDEERALELLSSNIPVVKYDSREEDNSLQELETQVKTLTDEKIELETQVKTLNEKIEKLVKKEQKN